MTVISQADASRWRVGERNLITDVPGLLVGNASDPGIKTGVTVLSAERPFIASVDVMGGAPGTRETDCLAPDKLVEQVDGLVLSGGSAFGLEAASGVVAALRAQHRGFSVGPVSVPIVPAAIIFDLINGGAADWKINPYSSLGEEAFLAASDHFDLGTVGAGVGATTAVLKGGLGSASIVMPNGIVVGALVVVNPHGSAVVPGHKNFWAAPFEMNGELGAFGMPKHYDPFALPTNEKMRAYEVLQAKNTDNVSETSEEKSQNGPDDLPTGMNTTIAVVATNALMSKAQLKRLAVSAQDGMARAIVPSHTPFDGDLIFAVSTAEQNLQQPAVDSMQLGHAASVCLSRAIARGVYHARSCSGDTLPSWQSVYGS